MDGGLSVLLVGDGKGGFLPVAARDSGLVVAQDAKSLAMTDLAGDGRPDLVIGVNDGPVLVFDNLGSATPISVRLAGPRGNRSGIGARVTLGFGNGAQRVGEITAGGGYLSQSPPTLYFSPPQGTRAEKVSVRWPDGKTTSAAIGQQSREVLVKYE